MLPPSIKNILHWIGSLLAFAGVFFVSIRLTEYRSEIGIVDLNERVWLTVTFFVFFYGFLNIGLSLAWRDILCHFGIKLHHSQAIKIYGLTQLAKYVPGNIVHLISRQSMGQAVGINSWALAKSSIWELGMISLVGAIFLIITIPLYIGYKKIFTIFILFVLAMIIIALFLNRFFSIHIARAFGWHTLFLTSSGLIFVSLFSIIAADEVITISESLMLVGAFVVAWLAGLITPGAPAGIGVREMVLIALVSENFAGQEVLLAVLLSRITTVSGDVLFYSYSMLIKRKNAV